LTFTLSSIFSVLYIALIFYILGKKNKIFLFLFLFPFYYLWTIVFFSQEKYFKKANTNLFCSYSISSFLFRQFGLVIDHNKSEFFHFSRETKNFNPLSLDLRHLQDVVLRLKDTWQYLGFFFNRKFSFWHHIYYCANKALSTIKSMKMLGNLIRGLSPVYKWLLYRIYVLIIILYGF